MSMRRANHVSDFDSSEQHRVFELDLDLPRLKPGLGDQWHAKFYRRHNSDSPELFKDAVTKCREEIRALKEARDKANSFFMKEFSGLEEKNGCPYTSLVLKTIASDKEQLNYYIDTAIQMLNDVEVDVETYLRSADDIVLESAKANDQYLEKLEQLGKIANVDKMIKYWKFESTSYAEIEQLSGLTPMDISCFTRIVLRENQMNFDIEANQDRENFGQNEVTALLNENVFVETIRKLTPFREAYAKAVAEVQEREHKHVDNFLYVGYLSTSLECAGVQLRVMRQQLKLLYDKNVIAKGYYEKFLYDWRVAGHFDPDEFDD